MAEPPKKKQRRHLNYNKCRFCRRAKKHAHQFSGYGHRNAADVLSRNSSARKVRELQELLPRYLGSSVRVTWLRRLKLYHQTVETAINAQEKLFDSSSTTSGSLRTYEFIRDEEASLFSRFLDEGGLSSNPLAALITVSCNVEVAPFRDRLLYPSGTEVPDEMVDQLWESGDIGTALVLLEIILLGKRNTPNKEINSVQLQKYCDLYSQTTERLKVITGREVPVVPVLHNLLLLTRGKVMFPSDSAKIHLQDYLGRSLLHLAVDIGVMEDTPRYFGLNITTSVSRDALGLLPLHIACSRNSETMVEYFLENNVDLGVANASQRSVQPSTTRLLVEIGASFRCYLNGSPTLTAEMKGDIHHWRRLDGVADFVCGRFCMGHDVVWAARHGHTAVVRELAINEGYRAIIELLSGLGADVNSKDIFGKTPLFDAIEKKHTSTVQILLDKGADVNFKDIFGTTPLYVVVVNSHTDIVRLLLDKGADINSTEKYGYAPLLIDGEYGQMSSIVKTLLENGADVSSGNILRNILLFNATKKGNTDILRLLLEKITHPWNLPLTTMLLEATRRGHAATVQLLLEIGLDPNIEVAGLTALQVAIRGGHEDVVDILRAIASGQPPTLIRHTGAEDSTVL
ncbi:ankyrin repeat-containing domain protein [Xylaria telfairii]|nr:ankyrin repeat-containing domain protein [Xylaria telfairii]